MTNQEKDQIAAEVGKELPETADYDQSIPVAIAQEWCLRYMGAMA